MTKQDATLVAGVDEAGRGPLAGPVYAAAVILDPLNPIEGLTDSKLLSAKKRETLCECIEQNALSFAVAFATANEIDDVNILQASLLAMKRAVEQLHMTPSKVLVDGNQSPNLSIPTQTIIKGDLTEPAISAASILAKVYRDRVMITLDKQYPLYGFAQHKGYPTKQHREAIEANGITPIHRRSFAPCKQLEEQII